MAEISKIQLPDGTSYDIQDKTSGYITGYTETDPIFSASPAAGITAADIINWNSSSSLPSQTGNAGKFLTTNGTDANWADILSVSSRYIGTIIGDGTTATFTINHNLNSRDVLVDVYNSSTYDSVIVDITRTTVNSLTVEFNTAPTSGTNYTIVVLLTTFTNTNNITIDTGLDDTSTNPVQNKAIKSYIDNHTPVISYPVTSVNNKTGDVVLTASDVSAQSTISVSGILKGGGSGNVSAAVAGTDYQAPLPTQTGQSGKFLTTDGTDISWATVDLTNYMVKGVDYVTAGQQSGSTLGTKATVEGNDNIASGSYSHAEGRSNSATAGTTHVEGYNTSASKSSAHAEGEYTTASGRQSHAEGNETTASGDASHAEGTATISNHRSQHVFGEYNIADPSSAGTTAKGNYVEIVGNGTTSTRSNARTLDWSGNETLAGSITVGNSVTMSYNSTTKSIDFTFN